MFREVQRVKTGTRSGRDTPPPPRQTMGRGRDGKLNAFHVTDLTRVLFMCSCFADTGPTMVTCVIYSVEPIDVYFRFGQKYPFVCTKRDVSGQKRAD